MNIVILDGCTLNNGDLSWEGFEKLGTCTVYDRTPTEKIVERIGNAEIVITNKTIINKYIFDQCPNIKYIGVLATGYNVVDTNAAKEKNIAVTNIPAYGTAAVAQYVFALLLEICHHVGAHDNAVHSGRWEKSEDFCFWDYPLLELAGKTLGIIGLGRIGTATARIANAFGMRVIAYDTSPAESIPDIELTDLDTLLSSSDVISLHCPLSDSSKGMINRAAIEKMKTTAILINTSRGPLVAEEDLADALNSGRIYGAAVDVVSTEPITSNNPLLQAKNCIITPHIAWAPKESRIRLLHIAVDNLEKFLAGTPVNIVNG